MNQNLKRQITLTEAPARSTNVFTRVQNFLGGSRFRDGAL